MSIFVIKTPRRIANKIILLVLALVSSSIILWGSLTYSSSRDELIKSKSSQLNEIASKTIIEIGKFFQPIYIEADVISHTLSLEYKKYHNLAPNLLHSFIRHRSEIEEVSLVNSEGLETHRISRMIGISKDEARQFYDDPAIEDALMGKQSIGSVSFSEYYEPTVRVATPVLSTNGNEQAIISIVNLKWLWDIVQIQQVEESGYVYVVDESLKLVAHPDPSHVLGGMHLQGTEVADSLFGDISQKNLRIYKNIVGDIVAGVSRFDPVHRWWIIVEQPVDEALAPLDRVINRFIMAFILAIFLTIITVVYFSEWMMRPLENLEIAIDRLTHGEKEVRVDVPKNSELSSLSEAFNEMAINLGEKTEKLEYQAHHDALTRLPNRKLLFEYIEDRLKDSNTGKPFSLLLLDLDRFKEINDSLGHKCGDLLLIELSNRLLSILSENEMVARLGGDEFAIISDDADEHFELEGMRLLIGASVGIALYPTHGDDSNILMRRADVAMYHAKKTGAGYSVYNESYDVNSPQRLALISGFSKAIKENELVLHYQPIVNVSDRSVKGVEALVRWNNPEHGLLYPDSFIPIVELGDSIIMLTNWVINQVLLDYKIWEEQGVSIVVSINVSTLNIQDDEFVNSINNILLEHRVGPEKIRLEITESVIMADKNRSIKTISALDFMGVGISIDDFGTGYSSLSYLKEIPVNELKIDKSFVSNMETDENDAVIVKSTIDLAHNLGLKVTAEGVETRGALELLDNLGCDRAQGFYICPPVIGERVVSWVKKWEEKKPSKVIPIRKDS
jgi:predicted signal transduction protein with EAL and GGDEF domain